MIFPLHVIFAVSLKVRNSKYCTVASISNTIPVFNKVPITRFDFWLGCQIADDSSACSTLVVLDRRQLNEFLQKGGETCFWAKINVSISHFRASPPSRQSHDVDAILAHYLRRLNSSTVGYRLTPFCQVDILTHLRACDVG